jgi:hypothetical protein
MVFQDAFCPQRLREPINDERRIKFRPEPSLYPVQITRSDAFKIWIQGISPYRLIAFAVMQATL